MATYKIVGSSSSSSRSSSCSSSTSSNNRSDRSSSSSECTDGSDLPTDEEREQVPRKRHKVVPYSCDPSASSDESEESAAMPPPLSPDVARVLLRNDARRLLNTRWCCCNSRCRSMPTTRECVCCQEQGKVKDKAGSLDCVTRHHLFALYCLNRDVLDLEYTKLRVSRPLRVRNLQHMNAKYRYTAYCQFVWWVYGKLGKENRVPLPSCVVTRVREEFPAPKGTAYKGFAECCS